MGDLVQLINICDVCYTQISSNHIYMNTRIMVPVLGVALIVGIGALVAVSKKPPTLPQTPAIVDTAAAPTPTPAVPAPKKTVPAPTLAPAPTAPGLSMAEIAKHSSRTSCWSAVSGSVYDLTSWIPNHPGGEGVILSMCGKDGTALYNGEHGSRSKPARILGGFKLGELSK
jgi:hypothetical protein